MKNKKGISLIVLVITIIVMVILAASVVLTLSNSGIINKANEAVEKTNIKEVEQLASIVWAEEFMAGKRGDTLKEAVLEKLKDYVNKYNFEVTDSGIKVTEKGAVVAGLFRTGTNELIYSWADLVKDGVVVVENGVVYAPYDKDKMLNLSSDILAGDLVLPHDGSIKYIGNITSWDDENGQPGFRECWNLTSVKIPASVQILNIGAFLDCEKLTKIEIEQGSKLTFIGEGALTRIARGEEKLEIIYPGTMEQFLKIDFKDVRVVEYPEEYVYADLLKCTDGTIYIRIKSYEE